MMETDVSPASVVREYFARVRARDARLADLFHEDACLIGLGTRRTGRDAIRDFYRNVIEGAGPTPTLVGDLLVDGARIGAEIRIQLANGAAVHALDLFEVEAGFIRSLTYFLASES